MGGGKCATCAAHSVRPHTPPRALWARPSPCRGGCEETRSRSRARTPPASDVKQRILFASPRLRRSASLPIQSRPLRAVAEQLFAARFRQERREAERRQTRAVPPAPYGVRGAPQKGRLAPRLPLRARSPADVPPHQRGLGGPTGLLRFARNDEAGSLDCAERNPGNDRRRICCVIARAPSTALRAVPLPRFRGGG